MVNQKIGTCVLLLDQDQQKVVLGKRKNSYMAGSYGLPGGRVELGEALVDTAKREVREETGIEILSLEFVTTIRDFQGTHDFVHFVFASSDWVGQPKTLEPEKCEGWEWFSLSNLPEQILAGHKLAIQAYQSQQKLVDSCELAETDLG